MDVLKTPAHKSVPDQPNSLRVGLSMLRALRLRHPRPAGTAVVDHGRYRLLLQALEVGGIEALAAHRSDLDAYLEQLSSVDPDLLSPSEALAYWINLYNAGAQRLALIARQQEKPTVLRVKDGFFRPFVKVAGEDLSLNDIEHGKVRRFKEPRIHGALNCCSISCPKLRKEPYRGETLDTQLEEQMRRFLDRGGLVVDRARGRLQLSRIFLWFGGDFSRPERMPTWLPARRQALLKSVSCWVSADTAGWLLESEPTLVFQEYDWGLRCTVG